MAKNVLKQISNGNFKYRITRSLSVYEGIPIYGIEVIDNCNDVSYSIIIEDVTCERNQIECLFDLLTSENVYPEHLYYVVEDFIAAI